MKLKKMWLDGDYSQNPTETSRQNKNVVLTESYGAVTNELGFKELDVTVSPIGRIPLFAGDFVVFTTDNRIGVVDNSGVWSEVIKSDDFNFSPLHPVTGVATLNFKGQRIVAFTDNLNPPRVINLDVPEQVSHLDLFLKTTWLKVESEVGWGGSLDGTFNPIIQLEMKDGSVSDWMIFEQSYLKKGNSLKLSISGIDLKFYVIRIGFVIRKNGESTAWIYLDLPVKEESLEVIITGDETIEAIDLAELVPHARYKTAKILTQFQDVLYCSGLTRWKEQPQQQWANQIKIKWTAEKVQAEQTKLVQRTFAPGEVYAFYVQYEYEWGWGEWFPIPGRLPKTGEKNKKPILNIEEFNIVNDLDSNILNTIYADSQLPYFYELNDTCSLITNGVIAKGEFSFWENKNEKYPDVEEYQSLLVGLAGQNVRHHKFPSLNWLRSFVYNNQFGASYLCKLGVEFSGVTLPPRAISYRTGYAKRDLTNSSFTGQTPIIYSSETFGKVNVIDNPNPDLFSKVNISTGGNWLVGGLNVIDIENVVEIPGDPVQVNVPRLYPPELLYLKPQINPKCLRFEYKISSGTTREERQGDRTGLIIQVRGDVNSVTTVVPDAINVAIRDFHYVPNNVIIKKVDNIFGEEHCSCEFTIHPQLTDIPHKVTYQNVSEQTYEQTYLCSIINYKSDFYNSFLEQQILPSTEGDCFVCNWSFTTYGRFFSEYSTDPTGTGDTIKNGIRVSRNILLISHLNLALRKETFTTTTGYNYYFPKSLALGNSSFLDLVERDKNPNNLLTAYDISLNAQNDLSATIVHSPFKSYTDSLPYRIARSEVFKRESLKNNWRLFFENNYYEMPKNRGKIINVVNSNNFLLIHHEKSLFKTRGNETFQTGENNIFVGYGDIFKFDPIEVLHDEHGSLGLQHFFASQLTTWGYFFIDAEKRLAFLVGEQIKEVTIGLKNFFLHNSFCPDDNPFQGYGYSVGVDYYFNRILLSKKSKKLKVQYKEKFRGVWVDEESFVNSLREGDIIFKDGKYQIVQL